MLVSNIHEAYENNYSVDNHPYRLKMQQKIAKTLENMSKEYSLSIVVTNHMTKKYIKEDDQKRKDQFSNYVKGRYLEPSLGLSWNSLICERLILKCGGESISESKNVNTIYVTNNLGETASFKVSLCIVIR